MFQIKQFPHCDSKVLHAPGECQVCDLHPEWQALRKAWNIAFTGQYPQKDQLPCPANVQRPTALINHWFGNRPVDPEWQQP